MIAPGMPSTSVQVWVFCLGGDFNLHRLSEQRTDHKRLTLGTHTNYPPCPCTCVPTTLMVWPARNSHSEKRTCPRSLLGGIPSRMQAAWTWFSSGTVPSPSNCLSNPSGLNQTAPLPSSSWNGMPRALSATPLQPELSESLWNKKKKQVEKIYENLRGFAWHIHTILCKAVPWESCTTQHVYPSVIVTIEPTYRIGFKTQIGSSVLLNKSQITSEIAANI